ncbi:PilZ domain-containing protein [Sphingomonas sp.]|uniref:PilZ domain-containing protein n=1 Tax=Sphingomonas sp. TaxID=28214 RepID=UPI00307DE6D5
MTDDPAPTGAPDHRAGRRGSVLLQAQARRPGDGEAMTLRIRNLSAHGLGGDRVQGMTESEPLVLALRGIGEVSGRVAWVAGSRFGFVFDHAIDPALIRTLPSGSSTADRFVPSVSDSYRRPGLKPRQ